MGLPINLPARLVRGKSPFTAEWGNSIREAISRLDKRRPPIPPAPDIEDELQPFEPRMWWDNEDEEHKAFFEPAHITIHKTGLPLDVTINTDPMETSEGVTVADGDVWYCKIDTSNAGVPSEADLQTASSPTNTEFAEALSGSGTDGEYYIKIATFTETDGNLEIELHHTGDIDWATRPWENVGTGAEVVKDFTNGKYQARSHTGSSGSIGSPSAGEVKKTVHMTVTENGNHIEHSAEVIVPDGGIPSGYEELTIKVCISGTATDKTFLVKSE